MENEIEEIRYQVGEAWKGTYNAETPYGVAAVVQDPDGLSVYRSLKNGNTGHPLSDSNWWFCIIDMSSIKEASDNVDALNTRVTEAEDERVEEENKRVTAENNRATAEDGRATAESERASSENSRKTAENARATAETNRVTAEGTRANAESGRVSAEQSRVLAESLRDNAESSRATAETNRAAAESERHTQYTADHSAAVSDHTTAQLDHTTAVADHEQSTDDHTASTEATAKANNVNATIDGMTVTITDKNGVSTSVNIGFDIAGTYASVAAMNADAANVQEGAFVMIATLDPTSQENARLYVRNSTAPTSSEPFTFLSDLDQAATSAWADWMENYKPTIIADHQRAETDHTTAAADHTAAVSDHNTATTDHTQAASDHSTAASDHTAAASDHTRAESDHTTAAADHTQAESDHQRAETDHNTMEPRIANLEENKANKDGYYSQMTVGAAETLVGETVDSEAYLIRPTGGESNEVANGVASVLGMEGNSCVWNQILGYDYAPQSGTIDSGNISYTRVQGLYTFNGTASTDIGLTITADSTKLQAYHKYILLGMPDTSNILIIFNNYGGLYQTSGNRIVSPSSSTTNSVTISFKRGTVLNNTVVAPQLIDLTLLGIDNLTTVAEVEAWLAEHVGTKPYYNYNTGTILSAQTLGIKTYGQNLLNPTTRQTKLIPYEWEDNSNVYTIKNVPSGATATFTPDATGVAETVDISGGSIDITSYGSGILELSAATAETYVCMKWDEGKDDDVVPFVDHINDFDVRKVYGKYNGVEYQCYPNGMRSAGSVHDTLTASEAVVRVGSVDLGTRDYYKPGTTVFQTEKSNNAKKYASPLVCARYKYSPNSGYSVADKCIGDSNSESSKSLWIISDSSYSTATATDFKTAMNGVMLNYELATPITYTDLIYRDGGIDTPLSDVLLNIEVDNWSIEEQLLTPYVDGNPTAIPAKISSQYGMDAVEEIDTIKHTYVSAYTEQNFSDSQKAQARRNIGAVEANGTYPDMTVGSAKNLAGENTVEAEYTYRQSGGTIGTDTGIANVTAVKGKSLVWNQMLQQGKLVDMGLPSGLLWATSNIDITQEDGFAASPFQYGCTMFSWGNIDGHNTPASGTTFDYNWGSVNAQEPYYEGQPYGETPGAALSANIVAEDTQDAARYNLGSLFKMPTSTQFKELVDNCDFVQADGTTVIDSSVADKRVTVNGVVGIYLKSKVNGNLIFFSASGGGDGSSWNGRGNDGGYWSASFGSARGARVMSFGVGGVNPQNGNGRYVGFAVRAVVNPNTVDTGHNNHKYLVTKDINVDLTLMFGADNEPSTVEEFEALYPLDYYDYNAGTLINNNASAIETTGFNQWDEEWEVGSISTVDGTNAPSQYYIRSKNYIPCFNSTEYYYKMPVVNGYNYIYFYDVNKNFISASSFPKNITGLAFTTPANCYFVRFNCYSTTYNHDICINISDPSKNGTYEPYEKHTFYFDKVLQSSGSLATVTGKLNGEGESVAVFPDGLKSAGNVYDEIKGNVAIKRIGSVDLGTLTWIYNSNFSVFYAQNPSFKTKGTGIIVKYTYNPVDSISGLLDKQFNFSSGFRVNAVNIKDTSYLDVNTFKTAMNGVMLYYELETPETYILDQTVTGGYQVNALGTEQRLPEDTASAVKSPIHYSVIYPIDAVGTITKLPINYISEGSLTNFTTELASKLGTFLNATIGINATYNQTNQEYDYSITITANQ